MKKAKKRKKNSGETGKSLVEKISNYIKENIDTINNSVELIFIEKEPEKNILYENIEKLGEVTNFELLKLPQLVSNIEKISKAYNVEIDDNTAKYLVECCGSGMQELINELRKVIEYAGNGGKITKTSIDELCIKQIQAIIFDLTDYLGAKNIAKALDILKKLEYNKEPVQKILITLYNHFKKLYIVKISQEYGTNLAESMNLKPNQLFLTRKYSEQAKYFSKQELRNIMQGLVNLDAGYKQGLIDLDIEILKEMYPELERNRDTIKQVIIEEKDKFMKTLAHGEKEFEKVALKLKNANKNVIDGQTIFKLYETYGFPPEITSDLAEEQGFKVDMTEFDKLFKEHQEKSRMGSEQKFKGGLAEQNEQTTKYHTATHLLHKALQIVLGEHAKQKGSNITTERLRFDFSHPEKMTPEQIKEVEDIVNEKIKEDLPVKCEEMTLEEAKKSGATGLFENKYGDKVKVYSIGEFSKEICGGPHVSHTGVLGTFKILKEESSSSGVRRIKAVLK